jgi:hypothetical protein
VRLIPRLSAIHSAVGALGSTGDLEDDDRARRIVDYIDHAKVTDAQAPEVRPGELHRAGRAQVDRQGKDRAPQSGGITWRKTSQLALGGRRELDSAASLAHPSPVP